MPPMPVLTPEQRSSQTRFENVMGKAVKDWVSRIMVEKRITRDEARQVALERIRAAGVGLESSLPSKALNFLTGEKPSMPLWRKLFITFVTAMGLIFIVAATTQFGNMHLFFEFMIVGLVGVVSGLVMLEQWTY